MLAMAACGTSGGTSSSGSATDVPTVALGTPAKPATGEPLKVFFFNEEGASAAASSPESFQAAEAAVDYVNKNLGGVKGRPLALTHCATLGTPDSVTNCANRAVDAKPDVVVKGVEVNSATAVPIITSAGIPYITQNAGAPAEQVTPGAFVLSSGFAALLSPMIPYAKSKGYKNIGVVYTNVTSLATALDGTVRKLAEKEGVGYTSVPVAITTADMTPAYSSLLAKKVDAIYVVTSLPQCASAFKARASLSDRTPLFTASGCNDPTAITTVPPTTTDGMIVSLPDTSSVPTDPDTRIYRSAMKQYQPTANIGSFAPSSFASIMNLYRTMSTVADPASLNAQSITATLRSTKNTPLFMGGGKTFTCDGSAFPKSPSICTGASFLTRYSNGNYQLVDSYDTSTLLNGIS
jgi:branched-chain amino acid transport system substrate-binding protein